LGENLTSTGTYHGGTKNSIALRGLGGTTTGRGRLSSLPLPAKPTTKKNSLSRKCPELLSLEKAFLVCKKLDSNILRGFVDRERIGGG
jgi:hypothetical protein